MSENELNRNDTSTFVALPINSYDNDMVQISDQYRLIKNVIIKTLSDGSVCLIDTNEVNLDDNTTSLPNDFVQNAGPPRPPVAERSPKTCNVPAIVSPEKDQKQAVVESSKPKMTIFKCSKCKEEFKKMSLYKKHMIWHRNMKKFRCDKCSMGYNVESNLKLHMAMHAEGKPTCPLCKVSFQRLASLKSHLMLHQVEELYTCEECSAEFEKEEELGRHLQTHLNANNKENDDLICNYCKVQFDDQTNYKEHISHHVKVKKMVLSGKKSRKTHGNKEYKHMCAICQKSFSKASLLERHTRVHSGERPFTCSFCGRGFNQKGTLQIHMSNHTGIKPFHCTLCTAKFNQKGNLRVHVEKTHTAPMPGIKTYKCSHCSCIFKKIASLNVHVTKSHGSDREKTFTIPELVSQLKELEQQVCSKDTPSVVTEHNKKILESIRHEQVEDNVSYVKLAETFLDGSVRRYLVKQRRVNDIRWYVCNYCSKEFKKPSDLMRHNRVHTREKPFVNTGDICKPYPQISSPPAQNHNIQVSQRDRLLEVYGVLGKCKQCGAAFSLKSSLFCHISTHIGPSSYACVICKKKFGSVRSLNLHLKKHVDRQSQQYKCSTCNKWFNTIQKARAHKETHHEKNSVQVIMKQPLLQTSTGLLPVEAPKLGAAAATGDQTGRKFQCPVCNYKSTKMPNLTRHMMLHTGDKKYKCEHCPKSYLTAHALREHSLYHTGVKNYCCKVCGKKFMTSSLLKRHIITHSSQKPFVCPYCHKSFKSVMLCRKHIKIHTKEINIQFQALNETGEINNLNESDKATLAGSPGTFTGNSANNDSVLVQKADQKPNTTCKVLIKPPDLVLSQGRAEEVQRSIDDPPTLDPALYGIAPNSIQIISNDNNRLSGIQDTNQVQAILINCGDLQLPDNIRMELRQMAPSAQQLVTNQLPNVDPLLFGTLNELQDVNVFNIDSINGDFDPQQAEIYNSNQIFNINHLIGSDQPAIPTIGELADRISRMVTKSKTVLDKDNPSNEFIAEQLTNKFPSENLIPDFQNPKLSLNIVPPDDPSFPVQVSIPSPTEIPSLLDDPSGVFNVPTDLEAPNLIENNLNSEPKETDPSTQPRKKVYLCTQCGGVFTNKTNYIKHFKSHNGSGEESCLRQCTGFNLVPDLEASSLIENDADIASQLKAATPGTDPAQESKETGYLCTQCGGVFMSWTIYVKHFKSHDGCGQGDAASKQYFNLDPDLEAPNLAEKNLTLSQPNITEIAGEPNVATEEAEPVPKVRKTSHFCTQCGVVFTNRTVYIKHIKRHSGGGEGDAGLRQCTYCLKEFKKQSDLIRHLRTHTGERPFACDQCDKKFSLKSTLASHQRTHNPVTHKRHNCVVCNSFFSSKSSLKVHMNIHTGIKPHQCKYCPLKFHTAANKRSHESTHITNPTKTKGHSKSDRINNMLASVAMDGIDQDALVMPNDHLSGPDLDNVLVVQDQLNILNDDSPLGESIQLDPGLILQHLQSSSFLLQDQFIPSSLIQLDDGTLLNIKTVNNDIDMTSLQQQQQQQDLESIVLSTDRDSTVGLTVDKIEEKPRNLECDICHKRYASKDVLRKHKKLHGVNRKFPCNKCDKGFDTAEALDKHDKVHAGFRPFSCLHCSNSFSKQHSLITHMKRIHNVTSDTLKSHSLFLDLT